ncbi:hypothetical protein E6Q11_02405 [Candidatus Dojkabacteria bacterium]|uniref:Glycosyltransferase family 9 protein n=1 Tax=Candidatus Dojkabacteria bacterium TaxID=2099670 RepID=A0A5C7J7S9_9BACT|nr:MAG: hypothetical protein E6Q11_02405 [Candidatus Dojkabacteria bacterium]
MAEPVLLNPSIFRPGSKLDGPRTVNFLVTKGGIGDYISWMPAILWIARNHPQVHGRLFVPPYFRDVAENLFSPFPNWKLKSTKDFTDKDERTYPTYLPFDRPINGTGSHGVDLGFIYYTNIIPPPEGADFYPVLDFTETISPVTLPENFAVLTPGSTYENRMFPPSTHNDIKDYLVSKGITPVYLGRSHMTDTRKIHFDEGYDYTNVINLIDKTTLMQAALIISKAKLILGIDNGLLHLAATTTTPIVFGYTIAAPWHRKPRRPHGRILDIYPDPEKLTCTFCQSKMRFMFNHDFAKCLYGDFKCTKEELSDPGPWIDCIEEILKDERTNT